MYLSIHNSFIQSVLKRIVKPWLHLDIIYERTLAYKKEIELYNKLRLLAEKIKKNVAEKMENGTESQTKNFLRELMNPKHNISESSVIDEILTVVSAGQDTTSIAMAWILVYLGIYKNVQQKVVDELHQVLGQTVNEISFEQVNHLEYLEQVIYETLRLQPVIPFIMRKVTEEITTSEGYTIPKYASIAFPIVRIHRNPTIWGEDAKEFKPERFAAENCDKIHPYAFLPFLKGPRTCIGQNYSMTLMKIVLANILMRYEIDSKMNLKELKYLYGISLKVADGHMVSIKMRKNNSLFNLNRINYDVIDVIPLSAAFSLWLTVFKILGQLQIFQ